MIVVRINGWLGNQMFQYALYKKLRTLYSEVYLDLSQCVESRNYNQFEFEFELGRVFPKLDYKVADTSKINSVKIDILQLNLFQRIFRKLKLAAGLPYKHYVEKIYYNFDDKLFDLKGDFYLDGFWQSFKYFESIEDNISRTFCFQPIQDKQNMNLQRIIQDSESVSLHIRRGDMVNNPLHGDICTLEYYRKALDLIQEKITKPKFIVFSDDIVWCKENLILPNNPIFVDWNKYEDSWIDMYLMSNCKHNIIANSSFSWWGAWLNQNTRKVVIAPSRMVNLPIDFSDCFPSHWLILEV